METKEFKPKDWVLVRDDANEEWMLDIFSHLKYNADEECNWCYCVGGWYYECIPYESNEHLLGTTDDYVEPYEPYKPKEGEDFWFIGIFGEIVKSIYRKSNDEDCKLMDVGNCFPTEEAAKPYAEKFKQLLKTRE